MKAALCASSLVALLIGCTPMTVRHDYDPDIDFSAFRTFGDTDDSRCITSVKEKRRHCWE